MSDDSFVKYALSLPFRAAIKYAQSVFITANQAFATLLGFKHPCEQLGITDADLRFDAARFQKNLQKGDQICLRDGSYQTLDIYHYADIAPVEWFSRL